MSRFSNWLFPSMGLFLILLVSQQSLAQQPPQAVPQQSTPEPPSVPAPFSNCFDLSPQRALSNAAPSGEFFQVSPEDCLRHCARDRRCHTMVFHRHFSTCQLYSGAAEGDGAREVGAKGHDLYSRKEADCEAKKKDERKEEEEKTKKAKAAGQ